MTVKSSRVVVSPLISPLVASSRSKRRMILPLRVLGSAWVKRMSSGRASEPISLATHSRSSSLSCGDGLMTAFQRNKGGDGLPFQVVRAADDGGLSHLGVGHQRGLHFHGAQPVPAHVDDVVDPAHQPVVAILVHPGAVAGEVAARNFRPVRLLA